MGDAADDICLAAGHAVMSYFATEADRKGYREIVFAKMRELRGASDDDSKSVFHPTSPDFPTVATLVSGIVGICQTEAIADGLEFEPDFVNAVVARLRASGLWDETSYVLIDELFDEQTTGDTTFWLHVNVACGHVQRLPNGNYAMTLEGVRYVQGMMRK